MRRRHTTVPGGAVVRGFPCLLAAWLVAGSLGTALAQVEESAMFGGDYLENLIVERDLAVRLRAAIQFTEDDDELIDEDPEYSAFPTRLYSTEAKLFHNSRTTLSGRWSLWENQQDLSIRRWTVRARRPLPWSTRDAATHFTLKTTFREGIEEDDDRQYLYFGMDRSFGDEFYTYVQYRHKSQGGTDHSGQLFQYLSWSPTSRFRIGEQAAVTREEGNEPGAWYARLFTTLFLVKETTALRFDIQHYDTGGDRKYQEYNGYAYQRLGGHFLLRLNYRLYDDNQGLSSHAYGAKLKCYFSERIDAYLGYRYYDHSEGADFGSAHAGLGVLL